MARSLDELPTLTTGFEELQRGFPRILAKMATTHGPIFKRDFDPPLANGITRVVYLVGPEANRLVLHTHRDHFSNERGWTPVLGPFFGRGLLNMDGAEWERHRKLMNPAFTAAYMARYLPVMAEVIRRRTADWIERGQVDVYVEAREIAFDVAAAALVGLTFSDAVDRLRDGFYYRLHARFDPNTETLQQMREKMERTRATRPVSGSTTNSCSRTSSSCSSRVTRQRRRSQRGCCACWRHTMSTALAYATSSRPCWATAICRSPSSRSAVSRCSATRSRRRAASTRRSGSARVAS